MTTETKPTQEELEELAALALAMAHVLAVQEVEGKGIGDEAGMLTAMTLLVGKQILYNRPPAWVRSARVRVNAKVAADMKEKAARGEL